MTLGKRLACKGTLLSFEGGREEVLNGRRGSYSFVHLATHKQTQRQLAVKIIDKTLLSARERNRLATEVDNQKSCRHSGILPLIETFETKHRLYIVMEAYVTLDVDSRC